MINEEILEEIIYLSKRGQLLDKKLIIKIALSIIDNLDDESKSIFSGIKFVGNRVLGITNFAQFDEKKGLIQINMDKMKDLKREYSILYCNLQLVEILMHEINHLRESYKKKNGDIEAFLITASDNFLSKNDIYNDIQKHYLDCNKKQELFDKLYGKVYFEIYDFIPGERIAEISAYEDLISSLNNISNFRKDYKSDYFLLKKTLFGEYVRVYVMDIIPLVEYFKLINNIDAIQGLSFYSPIRREFLENSKKYFKVEDRFKYGLPTDKKDKLLLLNKVR